MRVHQSHDGIVKRLKRAEGHLRSVIELIESEASCLKVAQQMHAVASAIQKAKIELIHDHIEYCLDHSFESAQGISRRDLKEFKEISKYL